MSGGGLLLPFLRLNKLCNHHQPLSNGKIVHSAETTELSHLSTFAWLFVFPPQPFRLGLSLVAKRLCLSVCQTSNTIPRHQRDVENFKEMTFVQSTKGRNDGILRLLDSLPMADGSLQRVRPRLVGSSASVVADGAGGDR